MCIFFVIVLILNYEKKFQSYCCGGEMGNSKVGGCTLHAQKCSAGAGIFLKPNKCEVLILMEQNRGTWNFKDCNLFFP